MELAIGLEPTTSSLQVRSSTIELRQLTRAKNIPTLKGKFNLFFSFYIFFCHQHQGRANALRWIDLTPSSGDLRYTQKYNIKNGRVLADPAITILWRGMSLPCCPLLVHFAILTLPILLKGISSCSI